MNPQETQELGEYIVRLRREHDLTILMIEHHMDLVMQFSDRIYVIDFASSSPPARPRWSRPTSASSTHTWGVVE